MKIERVQQFNGPSIYSKKPAFLLVVDLEKEVEHLGENARLDMRSVLESMIPDGPYKELISFTALPMEVEVRNVGSFFCQFYCELLNALQRLDMAGRIPFYSIKPLGNQRFQSHISYHDATITKMAIKTAGQMLSAIVANVKANEPSKSREMLDKHFAQYTRRYDGMNLGQTALALIKKAEARNIPWRRLIDQEHYVVLGQGKHQKQIRENCTSDGNLVGAWIVNNKIATTQMLADIGIPVPPHVVVTSSQQATHALKSIGSPVVVKPASTNKGVGISVNLRTAKAVKEAIEFALKYDRQVLVERFLPGDDHRMLVVGGKVVAVARRIPAKIVADGVFSIEHLVAQANADPRRGDGYEKIMNQITWDVEVDRVLSKQGFARQSTPEAGVEVFLRGTANLSTGGTSIDVTDITHTDNIMMAERAVRAVGINIAGLDFITTDISKSYKEIGGGICEINNSPGLRPHWLADPDRDVVSPIVNNIIPEGTTGRIPTAVITGSNGKTTTSWMLDRILAKAGYVVGLANSDGIKIGNEKIVDEDAAGKAGAETVLRNQTTEAAVLETARQGIIRKGLGFDECDVAAFLNIDDEHLGEFGVNSRADMAQVKGIIADVTRDFLVLNAEDETCLGLEERSQAKRVCYVSMDPQLPILETHISNGGVVVTLQKKDDKEFIIVLDGAKSLLFLDVNDIPATQNGNAHFNVHNAMFASALAYGMNVSNESITAGLSGFSCNSSDTPGRQNVYENLPFTAVVDYAHNPTELEFLFDFTRSISCAGKRILLFSSPGNRKDSQILKHGEVAASQDFDHYICFSRDDLRGRKPDELPALFKKSLVGAGVDEARISTITDEQEALKTAIEMANQDDLLIACYMDYRRTEKYLTELQN